MGIYKITRTAIYIRDNYSCVYCGFFDDSEKNLTLDHIKAVNRNGSNSYKNLATCCIHCNTTKKDLSLNHWLIVLQQRFISDQRLQQVKAKLEQISRTLPCDMRILRNKAKGKKPWCLLSPNHSLRKKNKMITKYHNRQYRNYTKKILQIESSILDSLKPIFRQDYLAIKKKFRTLPIEKILEIYLLGLKEEGCSSSGNLQKAKWATVARLQGISYELFGYTQKQHWLPNDC